MVAASKGNDYPTTQGKQGDGIVSAQRIGSVVKMDRRTGKIDAGNGVIFDDATIRLQRLIGAGNAMDGITSHLASEFREPFAQGVIGQVVQRHTVPAAMFLYKGNRGNTGASKGFGQRREVPGLRRARQKFQGNRPFHIGHHITIKIAFTQGEVGMGRSATAALSLPGINAGVSRAI